MKKIFWLLVGTLILTLGGWLILAPQSPVLAETLPYNCTADGLYTTPTSGPAQLDSSDNAKIAQASAWLELMTHTKTTTVTNSTINPDSDYASSYQGATSGTFDLQGRSFASDAVISISSPTPLVDSYRGVVSGQVLETPEPFRWIIQAYKRNAGVVSQVAVQALADGTTGNFSIDLTSVDPSLTGEWMFGILDANAGYAPHGTKWPDASYVGLEVRQYVITDAIYYWSTTAARTNGTFSFANSNTGSKMFRLIDTTTNPDDTLAEYVKPTGLLRSYSYESGETGFGTALEDRSFVYDQALALQAAISTGNQTLAKLLVDGLLLLQTTSGTHAGGFVFAAPQLSPTYTDMLYRTGAHAIATDALLTYMQTYPNDTDIISYRAAAENALDFLESTRSSSGASAGLYRGGYGLYSGQPQTFDPNYVIEWASTEHNIDTWHTLIRASKVLGNLGTDYALEAATLDSNINQKLYNANENRFNQGLSAGVPDTADPLDTNSWGAIQLYATGKIAQANLAIARVPLFGYTSMGITGFGPFYSSGGYPGATPTVWYEGSFGVALAYYKLGDYTAYRNLINALTIGQENDGSFRYATAADSLYEIGISRSVASTAWYILATVGRDIIWHSCLYNPPVNAPAQLAISSSSPVSTPNNIVAADGLSGNDDAETTLEPTPDQSDSSDNQSEVPLSKQIKKDATAKTGPNSGIVTFVKVASVLTLGGVATWLVSLLRSRG